MKVLALFAAVVAVAAAAPFTDSADNMVRQEWETFKAKHGKSYNNETEDKFRMEIFIENRIMIDTHNELYAKGEVGYELEANQFTDLLTDEFIDMMNGYNRPARKGLVPSNFNITTTQSSTFIPTTNDVPEKVDWREKGAVTSVMDQGYCGSCYASSAIGSLEGQHFSKTGKLVALSVQNIVDCSKEHKNQGCDGGWMENVFDYVRDNGGVDTEESYPYTATDEGVCHFDPKSVGATLTGYKNLPVGDEDALKRAVGTIGPVSVAIQVTGSFTYYKTGVYYDTICTGSLDKLNHAVLVVGYGTDDNGADYWLVKNSWGDDWGENGYIRMARNRRNNCGIASAALYPLV